MTQRTDFAMKVRILWALLSAAFCEWKKEVWLKDLDSAYCCNGRECGCHNLTVQEMYSPRVKL